MNIKPYLYQRKKGSLILNVNYYETQSSSISDYDKGCS